MITTENSTTKTCFKCKLTLERTTDNFYFADCYKVGISPYCKPCMRAHVKEERDSKRDDLKLKHALDPYTGPKQCPRCEVVYPNAQEGFHKSWRRSDGLACYCKSCVATSLKKWRAEVMQDPERKAAFNAKANEKAWRKANPEKAKEKNRRYRPKPDKLLKQYFGLTWDDYCELLQGQAGGCAICGKTPEDNAHAQTGRARRLAVDHDHTTGAIRGLLCDTCNRGIGFLRDDITLLRRAIEYLELHKQHEYRGESRYVVKPQPAKNRKRAA